MANEAKPLVKCSVSNCHYWGEQNLCHAEMIMIEIDRHSHMKLHEEYGAEPYVDDHQDVADKSSETCCLTFKPKG